MSHQTSDTKMDVSESTQLEQQTAKESKRSWCTWTPYIYLEEDKDNLRKHKYNGGDMGFSYILFYNPVANALVEYTPEWVAPNLITLVGFLHVVIPFYLSLYVMGPDIYGPVPSWFCLFFAWCYFWYRMFDEMDGKQARKTKNGSGLGLFFDHGCDCFTVGLATILSCKLVNNGNNLLTLINLATNITSFHLATLEEYYIGSLVLPPCNGVSDGSFAIVGSFIISGIYGPEFW